MRIACIALAATLASGCSCGGGLGEACFGPNCDATPCSGSACNGAPAGAPCTAAGQCVSARCVSGSCAAVPNGLPTGGSCVQAADCTSGRCTNGVCVDSSVRRSGCKHLDVVISVDNSSSMQQEKSAMRSIVFPAFAQVLKRIDGLQDFRVGVLDACPFPANFHTRGLGGDCGFQSGKVWMDGNSTSLVSEFACVGDITSSDMQCTGSNDDEQPASAAATSLEPPMLTGPNAGFLRDDAVLVVVAITDEDEQPTPNRTAQQVYDRLVAVKGGDVSRMVFLGIGGKAACTGVYGNAKEAVKLKAVTELFAAQGRGLFWDLCAGRLEDGLEQVIKVIAGACAAFPEAGGAGRPCTSGGQCASGQCTSGLCEGGSGGKPGGSPCTDWSECSSALCTNGFCEGGTGGKPGGSPCASGGECESGRCTNGLCEGGSGGQPDGSPCTSGGQCASGLCSGGTCGPGIN
ncbi:MAG: hypothetical protein HYZ28_27365 [Myxococcales bacterium]|nr:hypothetical protein [Myxococcales bacterium]